MLVIAREVGQAVVIGENMKVTVLRSNGGQVRLGIDAPPDVSIHREELLIPIEFVGQTSPEFAFE